MSPTLAASYAHCAHVAKTQARNFYYSFLTLSAERRAAMCAIYAFMRYSDDVSDEAAADADQSARDGGVARGAGPGVSAATTATA